MKCSAVLTLSLVVLAANQILAGPAVQYYESDSVVVVEPEHMIPRLEDKGLVEIFSEEHIMEVSSNDISSTHDEEDYDLNEREKRATLTVYCVGVKINPGSNSRCKALCTYAEADFYLYTSRTQRCECCV